VTKCQAIYVDKDAAKTKGERCGNRERTRGLSVDGAMSNCRDVSEVDLHRRVIAAEIPIIDPHHHLWVLPQHGRYLLEEFQADLATGHNVIATVYVECSAMYRRSGPQTLRSVGEAEFVSGMAAMSASGLFGPTRICAGFVGAADLGLAEAVDEVLDALDVASGGRLRGIRGAANWDADPSVNTGTRPFGPPHLLMDSGFRRGFERLAARGLVYDAWQYHPQLNEVADLAGAFPDAIMVVNHCGGLLGIGPYARTDNFSGWKAAVETIAQRPNILMKLGGLSGKRCGFNFATGRSAPSAEELATAWRPYIETCIELFGVERCMFESNFPPDRTGGSYDTIWNAFKLIAAACSETEKKHLFCETARRTYRID